jgi:23S rRNA pseudouridine1911/1915/1917 synthase
MKIIFEDDNILVLDKPAGITVNKSETTIHEETVQDWVENNFKFEIGQEQSDFQSRAGIVHRLDKETSGILLVAKDEDSFREMQRQFKEREVKKTYTALAHGKMPLGEGEVRVPVGRLPWNRKRFGVLAGGKDAVTKYVVIKSGELLLGKGIKEPFSLLTLFPETGRTHQIRVHLKYINHPIFADYIYAGRKTSRDDRKILSRVFLHASRISFSHPRTGERLSFESPLPEDLSALVS